MKSSHIVWSRIARLIAALAGALILLSMTVPGSEKDVEEKSAYASAQDVEEKLSHASAGEAEEKSVYTSAGETEEKLSYAPAGETEAQTEQGTERPPGKTVRAGWHEAPYYITGENGRRSGYSYEYQQKLSSYTGWNYEYVEGSWSDLVQMLKDGEIDLMANMSYTEERARSMLFPSLPMGTEAYYLFISAENPGITAMDYSSLNAKKVGVAKGSIQGEMFLEWEKTHNVDAELIELSTTEEESLRLLGKGLDAFVTMDVNADPKTMVPVCKIGSSDFYFAVSGRRPDLLAELNSAMSRIQDEDGFYNQKLNEKYLKNEEANLYLTSEELFWLAGHPKIRVGYQDNYMAFCARDEETGELTGTLKDYLDYASTVLGNARLEFEPVAYPTAADAIEALQNGEVDCVFPANMEAYDSEMLDVSLTPALMKTEMDAVVRSANQKEFIRQDQVEAAVNEGNTNYEIFLSEHFPGWKMKYYKDTPAGLDAVAAEDADCVIISNYRFSNIAKQCEKLHLTTVYTGVDMEYYLALRRGDTQLYSILSRVITGVPDSVVHAALTYYSTEDAKTSFQDLVRDNLGIVMSVIAAVLLIILILLLFSIRAQREAIKEQHLVEDLNKQIYVDALTHVRNKGGFNNYMEELQKKMDAGEMKEFALGVFDCDNLKVVNDQNGHDKGDIYLKTASQLICSTFQHSPVFRIGGDEFSVVLTGDDFDHREELVGRFETARQEICSSAGHRWEQVHVAMGIAVYDPRIDQGVDDTLRRADKIMYENKRKQKNTKCSEQWGC